MSAARLFELDAPFEPAGAEAEVEVTDDVVSAASSAESERLLRKAERALGALDEASALWGLGEALRHDPTNEDAEALRERLHAPVRRRVDEAVRRALGEAARRMRDGAVDDARVVLQEALAIAPGDDRLCAALDRLETPSARRTVGSRGGSRPPPQRGTSVGGTRNSTVR